jgi:acyl transferase domain-containing protein/3-hydroxymyristoyl/3-hydroxydecanoyl-(acyl carrier protein) dehydratase/NAD(P)-dependent dehydrogenase (short-subunit alcohol dehydrogenase family)/acyl carrier protein
MISSFQTDIFLSKTFLLLKQLFMKQDHTRTTDIAIIGMGCIFPKSCNLKEFWHLLFNGVDAIEEIPDDTHWQLRDYFDPDPSRPDHTYCSRGGFIPKINFDPSAFGIPPNNITATDTSQLLGLEVAKMALEDAGYAKDHPFLSTARVNVILGVTGTQELVIPLGARLGHPIWKKALDEAAIAPEQKEQILHAIQSSYAQWQENSFPGLLGNVVAGRIANRFNLSGTNHVSDAACASSLSALHSAVMELCAHKCDMSITGGVDCLNDIFMHMCFAKTGVLSHTSNARPFSKDADGTVLGEGIGMLVLKRLADAQKDKDRIYAVIKAVGTASDGKTSAIYAPDARGQRRALQDAYKQADIDPSSIGLLEAHGTGTRVGDKVEFTALKSCFDARHAKNRTAIGSVKSMIGHTKAAAGVAGIIKAALALHHKVIPGTLKADVPDPDLDINASAFYLNNRSKPWVPDSRQKNDPRRAGVSAFGFGGSNFHAVLEEYEGQKSHVSWDGSVQIAAFSARDTQSLQQKLAAFHAGVTPEHPMDDGEMSRLIAWQAGETRKTFCADHPVRLLMVLEKDTNLDGLLDQARALVEKGGPSKYPLFYGSGPAEGKLGFLFPGQGSQYPDMGKDLFATFPEAMDALCLAQKIFESHARDSRNHKEIPHNLTELMFALPRHVQDRSVSESRLRHTQVAQVAIGAVCLAMTRVLKRFGIQPHMACGHSFGELAAMHAAGWMDGSTLLTLAAVRGKHMAAAGRTGSDSGSMLAVQADAQKIATLLSDQDLDLVLANQNSPVQGVLSGPTREIEKAALLCKKNKLRAIKLPVAAAFHSHLVADAAEPFSAFVADQTIVPTDIQVMSNTTGKPYEADPEKIKSILGNQLMHPVRFMENIETMHANGVSFFVEAGPKTVLTGLVNRILPSQSAIAVCMDGSCGKKSGLTDLAMVLCSIAEKGFFVDLTQWEDPVAKPESKRMRVMLSGANPKPVSIHKPEQQHEKISSQTTPNPNTPVFQQTRPNTQQALKKGSYMHTTSHNIGLAAQTPPAGEQAPPAAAQAPFHTEPAPPVADQTPYRADPTPSATAYTTARTGGNTAAPGGNTRDLNAMHLVQKGLEAMQALQAQTARTHEKFLETQAQAGHTLAAIMEQTRQFMAGAGTMPLPNPVSAPRTGSPASPAHHTPPSRVNGETPPRHTPATTFQADPGHIHLPDVPSVPPASPVPSAASAARSDCRAAPDTGMPYIQAVLFATVSRLTGFPEEMLEPDMDIESDLGIDSIKKVEIISALEKELPDTEGLTTENIGSVRTLTDICQAIAAQMPQTDVRAKPHTVTGDLSSAPDPLPATGTVHIPDTLCTPDTACTIGSACTSGTDTKTAAPPVSETATGAEILPAPDAGSPLESDPFRITNILVDTISSLTGFPSEMLEPGMNLESDLGIDSIKRVEILSRLEQALGDGAKHLSGDAMAKLKTIQDIVTFLDHTEPGANAPPKKNAAQRQNQLKDADPPDLVRQKVVLTPYPVHQIRFFNGSRIQVPDNKKIYITRDQDGIAGLFKKEFEKQGLSADIIDIGAQPVPQLPDAAGIVIIQHKWMDMDAKSAAVFVKAAFALTRKNASHLTACARQKGAFLATITFGGGGFGFDDQGFATHPVYGGLAGLAKTAHLEWKDVLCHALDLPGDMNTCKTHIEAAAALMMTNGAVEMGLNGDNCLIPTLKNAPEKQGKPCLTNKDVVVITGGAKGVTAACAVALAQTSSAAIALVGRSPAPFAEPEWSRNITDPARLKKAILTHGFTHKKPKPADVEQQYQAICANRQIQDTMDQIRSHGSQADYWPTDIRDAQKLYQTIDEIRDRFGPVTAVIHGAGVLEDKLIAEKKPDQFNRVFDTKVDGLHALVAATADDPLHHMVLFSSIAARTGNQGQCDYAMANEVLNKTAGTLARKNPRCKYLSINWGPWDGGMVHEGLKRAFAKKGVGLIPLQAGCRQLIREMENPDSHPVEVVITAPGPGLEKKRSPVLSRVTELEISRDSLPILESHKINHEPVVPFALLAEVMALAAEKNNPGLMVAGLDDMRLLTGVKPQNAPLKLAVNLGKCTPEETKFTAKASLSSCSTTGQEHIHALATAVLKNVLPPPPVLSASSRMDLQPGTITVAQAYETILFHGPALQAIDAITGISDRGIAVTARPAPAPDHWFRAPSQEKWVTDPLLVDAAFQAAIIWTWENRGQVCLPTYMGSFRMYASFHQSKTDAGQDSRDNKVCIIFTVNENTEHGIKGYFTFLDASDTVVASITGFEAVVDDGLHEKFKPRPLFARDAILAFAQGKPSDAFGTKYKTFDKDRQIARLPRPPYFFMDRVLTADHEQWMMQPGGWIQTQYDIPENAWYFTANRTPFLPFCILLEIALQPCGWLAAYAGSALHSDARLYFRNLGGKAGLLSHITRQSGTLTIRVRMTDVSKAGGMIIQNFAVQVLCQGQMVYQGTTNFGFFTAQALAEQKGIRNSSLVPDHASAIHDLDAGHSHDENQYTPHGTNQLHDPKQLHDTNQSCEANQLHDTNRFRHANQLRKIDSLQSCDPVLVFGDDAPITPDDSTVDPDNGMPAKALRMIDTIEVMDLDGGRFNKGYIRAGKKNNPEEWFFDAHFYQDPVCPGSLGIEAFLQTIRFFLLQKYDIDPKMYTPQLVLDQNHEWIYRGQIIPANQHIRIHTHIRDVSAVKDASKSIGRYAVVADGALTVDGICIYEMKNFGVAFVR